MVVVSISGVDLQWQRTAHPARFRYMPTRTTQHGAKEPLIPGFEQFSLLLRESVKKRWCSDDWV